MKRFLLAFCLAVIPSMVVASSAGRSVLLTEDGTLFTAESQRVDASSHLVLTIQRGKEEAKSVTVPTTDEGGANTNPSLAWDQKHETLYIFWQKMPNLMSSELLFAAYHNGEWSEPTSIEDASFRIRFNLKIALTHYVRDRAEDDSTVYRPETIIHVVWWDQTGYGESARYAMLTLDDGKVSSIQIRELLDFIESSERGAAVEIPVDFDRQYFRYPALRENSGGDSVDVFFSDWATNRTHQIEVRPIKGDGVLDIPVGVLKGSQTPPNKFARAMNTDISFITNPSRDRIIAWYPIDDALAYIVWKGDKWSDLKTVALGEKISIETAVDALRRLTLAE